MVGIVETKVVCVIKVVVVLMIMCIAMVDVSSFLLQLGGVVGIRSRFFAWS